MKPINRPKPTGRQLMQLGLSQSYASELANGHKLPSLRTAQMIEECLGYPANRWALREST